MKAMDKIIGYSSIKRELRQISDTLKNREAYDKLGVSSPRGLLLYGEPGVGKSLMAAAIIEESGRQAYICRKDKPNGDFVKYIKETFDKAVAVETEKLSTAEKAYTTALSEFTKNHPEGYHMTLRDGDHVVTLSNNSQVNSTNLKDALSIFDLMSGLFNI